MTGTGGAFAIGTPHGSATEHIPNEQRKKKNRNITLEENN